MTTPTSPAPAPPPQLGWLARVLLFLIGCAILAGVAWLARQEFREVTALASIHTTHLAMIFGVGAVGLCLVVAAIPGALPQVEAALAGMGSSAGGIAKTILPFRNGGGGQ